MGIKVFWDNDEQTILRCEFLESWAWDDLHRVAVEIQDLSKRVDYEIGSILNMTSGLNLPTSIFSPTTGQQFHHFIKLSKNGQIPMAVAGKSRLIKMIHATMHKLDSSVTEDVYFAKTLHEARNTMSQRLSQGEVFWQTAK